MKIIIMFISTITGLLVFANELSFSKSQPVIVIVARNSDRFLEEADYAKLITAVWDSGDVIWSTNLFTGEGPYFHGKISANDLSNAFASFQNSGLFSIESSNSVHVGADSDFIETFVLFGTNVAHLSSWHEIYELNTNLVATSHGITTLDGRKREDVLKNDDTEYQDFRTVWAGIRTQIDKLLPRTNRIIDNVVVRRTRAGRDRFFIVIDNE